ncbi:MAG: NAD-dependent epimerase/dehydratase family protein, partial [Nanoarchaeota archaeon]|nr:NAD-dependent epimerase/dehydratase family protein [Nanoarchaeota archaeon]
MLKGYDKILVSGGAGFIGSHLVDALLALNKEVVVFDNLSTRSRKYISAGANLIIGDIRNPKQVIKAARGIDLVFHTAANANGTVSVNNFRFDFEVNATGTLNTLEAALKARVKKFVYVSSASVYGKPLCSPIDEKH